jgi:F-type H+-transporting ATPase subunit b
MNFAMIATLLVDFSPLKPDFGLLFWSTVFFSLFWLLVGKMAFKPIVKALKDRQEDIRNALDAARQARSEMSDLKAENERVLAEAREEKMEIIKEAKVSANLLVAEARDTAKAEAQRILQQAKVDIETAKMAAMVDVKNEIGAMALQIAEKVIRKQLSDQPSNVAYIQQLMDEMDRGGNRAPSPKA